MSLLSAILTAFWTDDRMTRVWLVGMGTLALLAAAFLLGPLELRLRQIIQLRAKLQRVAAGEASEADRQELLGTTLNESLLAQAWKEFQRQWRDARGAELHNRAPVRFSDALELFPLMRRGQRTALIAALPGVFLGLGILGTFFGLVLGLPEIGGQFRHGEVPAAAVVEGPSADVLTDPSTEELKVQIDDQIHKMTAALGLAFKTSLWGLTLSMLVTLWIRRLEGSYQREEEGLDEVVRNTFGWVGPGELQSLSLRKQAQAFDMLRTEITTLSTELSNVLSGGLESVERSTSEAAGRLSEKLEGLVRGIERSMANAATLVTEEQRQALGDMVKEISDTIQAGVGEQLQSLAAAVTSTRENQQEVARILAETLDQITQATTRQKDILERINATAEGLDRVATKTMEGADRVAPVVEQLKEAGAALEQAAQVARQAQEAAKASLEILDGALVHSRDAVEEQRRLVETSLAEMRAALDTISAGLGDSLLNALRRVDEVLGQAVTRLSGTLHDSGEILDRLSQPIAELRDHLSRISAAVDQVGGMVTRLGPELSAGLQPVSANLARVGLQVAELVAVMGEGFGSRVSELQEGMTRSADRIDSAFERLARELGGHVNPLQRAVTEASKRLESVALAVEGIALGAGQSARATPSPSPGAQPDGTFPSAARDLNTVAHLTGSRGDSPAVPSASSAPRPVGQSTNPEASDPEVPGASIDIRVGVSSVDATDAQALSVKGDRDVGAEDAVSGPAPTPSKWWSRLAGRGGG